ncbi:GntR family transcriptional regulator [Streptomyces calidiresistens]|uniref:UTRA domain-containing protein n=1 Tax=Streptomyces calidiresistens TaxID=1485586 RepID=A0A7W3T305_9ACTN|nr:GntR family transcriptional regulator [Streptomyces calidiresistens]MBB0230007.1 UTRA domain-containing protein [Streptomyces calidiresistens]
MTASTTPGRRPPSQQIADELRQAIADGSLGPGARLPSERALAQEYKAARNTAARALQLLEEQGLITIEHGKGAFVRERQRLFRFGNDRYSFRHRATGLTPFRLEVTQQGKEPRVDVVGITREDPPEDVGERLGVAGPGSVLHRENHYFADDEPVQIVSTFLRWDEVHDTPLMQPKTGKNGIYGRLEDLGHVMTTGRDEVTARMPTPEETETLRLPAGVPVVEVLHTSFDQNGEPFEVTRYVHRADRTGLVYDFPVDQTEEDA